MVQITATGIEDTARMLIRVRSAIAHLRPAFDISGMNMQRKVALRFSNGGPGWKPSIRSQVEGGKTLMMTGRLRSSIGSGGGAKDVMRSQGIFRSTDSTLEMGTNVLYAKIHQNGGTINAKPGKALAIPLNRDARRAVVGAGSKGVRGIPGLIFIPSKKPNTIGVLGKVKKSDSRASEKRGLARGEKFKKGDFIPWFALKTFVKIPARPFMFVDDTDIKMIEKVFSRYVEGEISKGAE